MNRTLPPGGFPVAVIYENGPVLAQMTDEKFIAAGISRKTGNRIEGMSGGECQLD